MFGRKKLSLLRAHMRNASEQHMIAFVETIEELSNRVIVVRKMLLQNASTFISKESESLPRHVGNHSAAYTYLSLRGRKFVCCMHECETGGILHGTRAVSLPLCPCRRDHSAGVVTLAEQWVQNRRVL